MNSEGKSLSDSDSDSSYVENRPSPPASNQDTTLQPGVGHPVPGNCSDVPDKSEGKEIDGHFIDGDMVTENFRLASHSEEGEDPSTCPTMTPSLAAAVPTNLRASRRESVPGAFRMSRTGAAPPGFDTEDDEPLNVAECNNDEEQSVGFHTGSEVLIEATLVYDRFNGAPALYDQELLHTVPPETSMALVEAKPLGRFSFCVETLGSWKSLCFIFLVIIAIAGAAVVIERYRQASQSNFEDQLTDIPTLAPTRLRSWAPTDLPLEAIDELTTLEEEQIQDFQEVVTSIPNSASPFNLSSSTAPTGFVLPLPNYTLKAMKNAESPQLSAYKWVESDPRLQEYSVDRLLQRFVLATFYFSLMNGNNFDVGAQDGNWLSYETDECTWLIDTTAIIKESTCFEDGSYERLSARSGQTTLAGTLPRELGVLTTLRSIVLHSQNITGSLPTEFTGMVQLETLELLDLSLSNSIPSALGRLDNLTSLKLSENKFSFAIPSELGLATGLQYLHLDQNELSRLLPSELGQLTALKEAIFTSNVLTGTIPSEIASLRNLERLYLNDNNFTGHLDLTLYGDTSTILPSLQFLLLSRNKLTGHLPTEIGLLKSAVEIDLAHNLLEGPLPSELGQLQNVSVLLLDSCQFSGTIPASLGNLTSLSELWLHNTNLTGSVPSELCELQSRQVVVISIDCGRVSCDCDCTCR